MADSARERTRIHPQPGHSSMPICEIDPWRLQYFNDAACPADVYIPTEDSDAWTWNPAHRWVYDKIAVALSQGLEAGPHGTTPPRFPVFSKPITNLKGMGIASRIFQSAADYDFHCAPGHMWMTFLEGRHVSSDVAVVDGKACWWCHVTGLPAGGGMFDYWIVHHAADASLEARLGAWIERHLRGYTGMLNLESIGGVIIDVHLRITDQWPDLYGTGWVDAVIALYDRGVWQFTNSDTRDGFSIPLFGPNGQRFRHPPPGSIDEILRTPGIASVQITFHEDRDPSLHAMPPGGFRLAIINCRDRLAGMAARERLRAHFLNLS
jgi:hypothetical protein